MLGAGLRVASLWADPTETVTGGLPCISEPSDLLCGSLTPFVSPYRRHAGARRQTFAERSWIIVFGSYLRAEGLSLHMDGSLLAIISQDSKHLFLQNRQILLCSIPNLFDIDPKVVMD